MLNVRFGFVSPFVLEAITSSAVSELVSTIFLEYALRRAATSSDPRHDVVLAEAENSLGVSPKLNAGSNEAPPYGCL